MTELRGVGIGLGVGLTYVPSIGAVQPWFGANRAFASGLAVAGIGAGNIAGPLLAEWWIGLAGWRGAYLGLALFALVLGGAAALAIRESEHRVSRSGDGVSVRGAMRTAPLIENSSAR